MTPAVAVAATAPAFAASPCTTSGCPNISFGAVSGTGSAAEGAATADNGWTWSPNPGTWSNRGAGNPVGFRTAITSGTDPMAGKGSWFAATAEPTANLQTITLTQTGQPALISGCSYTIRFGVVTYTDSSTPLIVRALVGGAQVGEYSTAAEPNAGYTDRGIKSFVVPGTASGVVSFRFVFGNLGNTEDIKLYGPSITCA